MEEVERKFLTKEEALDCLIIKDGQVHNFINGGFSLIGADWSIKEVEKCLEKAESIEIGGDNCRKLNHGIVVIKDGDIYFFEADNEKLDKYDK